MTTATNARPDAPTFLSSLAPVIDTYDAFILDLWGVIHDGRTLYPGVKRCLEAMAAKGKQVVLLSNAPRRAGKARKVLQTLGISEPLYHTLLTSGEVVFQSIHTGGDDFFRGLGPHYFFIGPEKDLDMPVGLACTKVEDLAAADFVLNVGHFFDHQPMTELMPLLEQAQERNLPMICANPDLVVVRQSGEQLECAGVIAEAYAEIGGAVRQIGKPYPEVYARCFETLYGVAKPRILAVGDNLDTDIVGARRSGIDSALVTGGVLSVAFAQSGRDITDEAAVRSEIEAAGTVPTYVIPALRIDHDA